MTDYTPDRADRYLDYVAREWESVPEIAEWWPELDGLDREVIHLEWGIPQDRLGQLHEWATQGLLTPEQMGRYRELLKLVGHHRPTLERLFEEEEPAERRKAA